MKHCKIFSALLAVILLCGCSSQGPVPESEEPSLDLEDIYIDAVTIGEEVEIEDEAIALSAAPQQPAVILALKPEASGTQVQRDKNGRAAIDYSNAKDGYVMVKCSSKGKRLRVQVFGPSYNVNKTKYTYDLTDEDWTTFPLSDGNGSYKVGIYELVSGKSYSVLTTVTFNVTLTDEFAPFLRPNQYVNYEDAEKTMAKAAELTQGITDPIQKVGKIYEYVVNNLSYDHQRASDVMSGQLTGYLPVLDSVLAEGKGICFDYAALMAGMLRNEGIPCKMVVGYADKAYHAWVSVWTEETGWVEKAIYFDGSTWHRMDPTFISTSNNDPKIQEFVGNGSNYQDMYLY